MSDAQAVIAAIARGDIDTAQRAFKIAADKTSVGEIARAVSEASPPPPGAIIAGPAMLVWANPFREDYGWRCGTCPWTAGLYKTQRGQRSPQPSMRGSIPASRSAGSHDRQERDRMSPRLLEGTPALDRSSPKFYMGCTACKWLEARRDVVEVCESGQHRAQRMEVQYTCVTCRWTAWCGTPAMCSASKSHKLTAEDARPIQ